METCIIEDVFLSASHLNSISQNFLELVSRFLHLWLWCSFSDYDIAKHGSSCKILSLAPCLPAHVFKNCTDLLGYSGVLGYCFLPYHFLNPFKISLGRSESHHAVAMSYILCFFCFLIVQIPLIICFVFFLLVHHVMDPYPCPPLYFWFPHPVSLVDFVPYIQVKLEKRQNHSSSLYLASLFVAPHADDFINLSRLSVTFISSHGLISTHQYT